MCPGKTVSKRRALLRISETGGLDSESARLAIEAGNWGNGLLTE